MHGFYSQLHRELQQMFDVYLTAEGAVGVWARCGYAIEQQLEQYKSILFVGLNPCYTDEKQPEGYAMNFNALQEEFPRFFEPYNDLANLCQRGDDWLYTDLFYYRETEQNKLWPVLNTPEGRDFITRQLQFTMRLLDYLRPDIIVVCHPDAHRFFRVPEKPHTEGPSMGYTVAFSPAFGVHQITGLHENTVQKEAKGTSLIGTPVLFTEDLHGMNPFAQQRLAWQIKQILKHHEIFFGYDPHRQGQRVNKQIAKLVMKLAQMEKSKEDLIQQGEFDAAAQFRDRSTEVRKEMLEVLLKVVGESSANEI